MEDVTKRDEIRGSLNLAIKKIPNVTISGGGSLEIDDNLKEVTEGLNVSFHGDFIIENSPTTYEEAIAVYKGLSGKKWDQRVGGGWVNQAYYQVSTTHGHISD